MDSALPPLQPTPTLPRPRRSRVGWIIAAIIIILVAAAAFVLWRKNQPSCCGLDTRFPLTPEEQAALQAATAAFEESKAQQRLANLAGIHLLISKYREEHGSYPNVLSDLTDIKGYAPGVARMVSETKLADGRPAYTYTVANGSYQLCANQKDADAKCEGPK